MLVIIGIIQDERDTGLINTVQQKHAIVQKARQSGGNAVTLVSSQSQLAGYYTVGSYGGGFATATTFPLGKRSSTYLVIRYVD